MKGISRIASMGSSSMMLANSARLRSTVGSCMLKNLPEVFGLPAPIPFPLYRSCSHYPKHKQLRSKMRKHKQVEITAASLINIPLQTSVSQRHSSSSPCLKFLTLSPSYFLIYIIEHFLLHLYASQCFINQFRDNLLSEKLLISVLLQTLLKTYCEKFYIQIAAIGLIFK